MGGILDVWLVAVVGDTERAALELQRVFQIDAERARKIVASIPVAVKRGLEPDAALRMRRALEAAGARVEVREAGDPPRGVTKTSAAPPTRGMAASPPRAVPARRAPVPAAASGGGTFEPSGLEIDEEALAIERVPLSIPPGEAPFDARAMVLAGEDGPDIDVDEEALAVKRVPLSIPPGAAPFDARAMVNPGKDGPDIDVDEEALAVRSVPPSIPPGVMPFDARQMVAEGADEADLEIDEAALALLRGLKVPR